MSKCDTKHCRNEATLKSCGKYYCDPCYKAKCERDEQEWMEKEWDKALKFVGVKQ